ncbi:MAG TPA: Ig-like domain repeat protein, partial [Methanobacterium sp.]|nr:Ig-like domain repeat protein [Methanobacterium sp.]
NKGKTVTLKATLKDYYGTPINNKTVEFYVNNVKVGENTTDTNGLAAFNYNIDLIGGAYNITAKFTGDTEYLASNDNGTLKVNQSSVYVLTTASKTNPTVGETITLNFKLGNNGPDPADDVVFTYVIPDGMEFVSLETEPGYPEAAYNPETRTITWNLGTVPKLDPWLKLNVKVLKSGIFNVNPAVITSVYDPALGSNIQFVTVNAVQAASAASTVTSTTRSIGMQETGLPIPLLVLAILMVLGGSLVPKRK